jgi:hypothetical protein
MFDDFYDVISHLWSWRWPTAKGRVTGVLIEYLRPSQGAKRYRLSIAYEFSIGEDGPYTGESF